VLNVKMTEIEIRNVATEIAKETLREYTDRAMEMEDMEFLLEARRSYQRFMAKYYKQMVWCG